MLRLSRVCPFKEAPHFSFIRTRVLTNAWHCESLQLWLTFLNNYIFSFMRIQAEDMVISIADPNCKFLKDKISRSWNYFTMNLALAIFFFVWMCVCMKLRFFLKALGICKQLIYVQTTAQKRLIKNKAFSDEHHVESSRE